jgi:hypothetical protein
MTLAAAKGLRAAELGPRLAGQSVRVDFSRLACTSSKSTAVALDF